MFEHDKIERARRSTFVLAAMSFEATDLPFPTVVACPLLNQSPPELPRVVDGLTTLFGYFRFEKLRTVSS